MSQHDYDIANQSFPAFRTDLNNVLSAINSSNSGSSRPSSAVAGTIWLDTSGAATAQLLKMYDGADDILLGTINFTANTIDWADSASEVSLAGVETLTNKTLTSPKINEDVVVTSTATELNKLDGVTSTTAELNILDGVTSTAAELNILDGVTSTTAELNKLDALSRGSILYGNASAVTSILTTGTVGQFLTTDGTDISWGDGGKVLQVVTDKKTSTFSTTSQNVYVTTSQSVTITPSSASNKILVLFSAKSVTTTAANTGIEIEIRRAGTGIGNMAFYQGTVSGTLTIPLGAFTTVDSPNTTSAIIYEVFAQELGIPGTVALNADRNLTVMEISA